MLLRRGLGTHRLGLRFMSKESKSRGQILELDYIDPYIPNLRGGSIFGKDGRAAYWASAKRFLKATLSVAMLRMAIKGWKPRTFALEAQEKYVEVNQAFAAGNLPRIRSLCTPGYASKLKHDMKHMEGVQVKWTNHGTQDRSKVVHVAQAKAEMPEGEQKIVQVTVEMNLKQSVSIIKGGKKIGGSDEVSAKKEYIVLERWIDKPEGEWLIKGKIESVQT